MRLNQFEKLNQELNGLVTDPKQPVVSVAAMGIKDGQVVYHNQFGCRKISDLNVSNPNAVPLAQGCMPVDKNTLYRIASISKLVTAVAVMRLVEEKKLNLDEDLSVQLGWLFRNPSFPNDVITLRDLLTHRSSLSDGPGMYWWDVGIDLQDVLKPGGKLYKANEYWEATRAPGTWFNYVNLNFGVIATVMERATGERFDRLMKRLVLDPLQTGGGFNPAEFSIQETQNIAVQYRKRATINGREVWNSQGPWVVQADDFGANAAPQPDNIAAYKVGTNGTIFGPQGRLRISVAGLGKIMQMFLNNGQYRAADGQVLKLLQPSTLAQMFTEQWNYNPTKPNGDTLGEGTLAWALGIQKFIDQGKDRVTEGGGFTGYGHYGDAYGLMGTFAFDPTTKCGQILVITGPSVDPSTYPSVFSTMYRWEEIGNTAIFKALQ